MSELFLLIILLILIIIFLLIINNYDNQIMNIYITFIIVISYILSFRNLSFIGMNINSNIILYSSLTPLFYFYLENNKKVNSKKLLNKNIIISVITLFLIMLVTGYIPSVTDNNAINIQNIFGNNFSSLISYPISLILTIYLIIVFRDKLKSIYQSTFYTILILGSIVTAIDILVYNLINYSLSQSFVNIIFIMTVSYIIRMIIIAIYALIIDKNQTKKKVKK